MDKVMVVWAAHLPSPAAAHVLLRGEVARTCAVPPEVVRLTKLCAVCGSSTHGKPAVTPTGGVTLPHVSLSRAGDRVLVAVTHCGPVGVDIERAGAPSFAGFHDVVLHPRERAATSVRDRAITWARKESLLKATGDGLSVDPRAIRLSDPGEPPALVEWVGRSSMSGQVWMYDVDVGADHVACVTVLGGSRPEIAVREGGLEEPPREAMPRTAPRGGGDCAPGHGR